MKKCKHDFKTLQQQVLGKSYIDGLLQCKKCKNCFIYGTDDITYGKLEIKLIEIKE